MAETDAAVATPTEDWKTLPWRKLEQKVFRLQKRIYQAERRGNVRAVHSLQRLLMKSEAARLLAVRRVTQDNQGKRTAGIDGIKAVKPNDRFVMAQRLRDHTTIKAQPVRRIMIPKPGKDELRPLGIPVMLDRAHQALVKLALEPQWEARFEPNSYGFRPGRSTHDAIEAIWLTIYRKPKYVLDADIKGCFDNINHQALLKKIDAPPDIYQATKAWLKAGIMTGLDFTPTEHGTPQGGVISPLLANIALHGLETHVEDAYDEKITYVIRNGASAGAKTCTHFRPKLVRYADDFVVLHQSREGIEAAQRAAEQFLAEMGLHLSPTKTRVTHTLEKQDGHVGFDFLGFHIRNYPVGKYRTHRDKHGNEIPFRTYITPSKENVKRHIHETGQYLRRMRGAQQRVIISHLNPIINGWARYYRGCAAKETFSLCDHLVHQQTWGWGRWRHKNKSHGWIKQRYWKRDGTRDWVFQDGDMQLLLHKDMKIVRHTKVTGNRSPYDGDLLYWAQRLQNHPLNKVVTAKLLKRQRGRCMECGLIFQDGDLLEIDHIDPKGGERIMNKQLLHRHCHDVKTVEMGDHLRHRRTPNTQ
jgi:RNA-directed DNA polymerase